MHFPTTLLAAAALVFDLASCRHVQWKGVNLFGLANDVSILGSAYTKFTSQSCNATYESYPYIDPVSHYHDWKASGFNLYRVAVAWQHAQDELGGPLNETNLAGVDALVDAVTGDGGQVILDIHNYARWYCSVIGQPEISFLNPTVVVTNEHFVDLWIKLARRYKDNHAVIFQLMNEPHDLDIVKWGTTNQLCINAIRKITTKNKILVSGTQFARLTNWIDSSVPGIGPGMIQDSANNTLYDFHQYFDDIGGSFGLCEPWSTFLPSFDHVTKLLRETGFQAMLTEFGGGPFEQCANLYQHLLAYLDHNSDVWYGWTTWGSFNVGSDLYLSLDSNSTFNKLTRVLQQFAPWP